MISRIHSFTALALILGFASGAVAQSDSAWENANDNADFKRCGTKHPTPREAKLIEDNFRKQLARQNLKKPKGVGGGNVGVGTDPGDGGNTGVLPDPSCTSGADV